MLSNTTSSPHTRQTGGAQPVAMEAVGGNTQTRLVAALNGLTGQVLCKQRSHIGKEALVAFYAQVRAAYPDAETIYIVQDNWPTHKSPAVMASMRNQRLRPLFLPTYASWLNPIEKLWRWLRQDVLHLHPFAYRLDILRTLVTEFLDQFHAGSKELLRYVGLMSK